MRIFRPEKQWFSKTKRQKKSDDKKWKKFRLRIIEMYGTQCMCCDTTEGIIQVDHIKPKHVYRSLWYDENNMQILCKKCNMRKGMTTKDYRFDWAKRNPENKYAVAFLARNRCLTPSHK